MQLRTYFKHLGFNACINHLQKVLDEEIKLRNDKNEIRTIKEIKKILEKQRKPTPIKENEIGEARNINVIYAIMEQCEHCKDIRESGQSLILNVCKHCRAKINREEV